MNAETQEIKRNSTGKPWILVIVGFFLTIALLIGVVFAKLRAENRRDHAEVQKRLDAIRAAGLPMSAQDLAKLYPDPPPELDARLLLKPALAMLSDPQDPTNLLFFDLALPRFAPLDESAVAEGQLWLERNQAAFGLIPWSKLEGAWFGVGFTNDLLNLTQAPLHKMNCIAKLLCLRAVLEAERQNPREAMRSLQQAAMVANTLKNDLPIHFLVKDNVQTCVSRALERIISRVNLSDADLASFSGFLTITNIGATKESVIINERPLALLIANFLQSGASQLTNGVLSPGRRLIRTFRSALLYHDADLLHYLKWSDSCLAALELPMTNAIPLLRKMEEKRQNDLKNKHVSYLDAFKKDRISLLTAQELQVTRFLLPELRAVAHVRLAIAAMTVERWRHAHGGRVPDSLAEQTPDFQPVIPTDPFDGQPLHYKKLATGYVLYSIGEDLTDDGGKEETSDGTGGHRYDITFTVNK